MVIWFAWVIWEEFFSQDNTLEGHTEVHKSSFFPYKHASGRNGDHEWLRMTNAFILCDLVWKFKKVMQRTEKVALNIFELSQMIDWHMKCDDKPMWEEPND